MYSQAADSGRSTALSTQSSLSYAKTLPLASSRTEGSAGKRMGGSRFGYAATALSRSARIVLLPFSLPSTQQ
jgi:hypothetical protein